MMEERRKPPSLDEAKFSTQKIVTLILLLIFSTATVIVLMGEDQAERSMMLQTVINLTILGVGYWLGSSKGATDSNAAIGQIAAAAAPATASAVAANVAANVAATASPPPILVVPVEAAPVAEKKAKK